MTDQQRRNLSSQVQRAVETVRISDIHTHLYDPALGDLLLWGIDDLLVYHYLIAEGFRYLRLPYEKFRALSKVEQADLIWDQLFIRHSPISESCRGVLTTLNALGLDVKKRDLPSMRQWFARQKLDRHLTRCMELAGLERIYMTNSPFDDVERPVWERGFRRDKRFVSGLRIDPLLLSWPEASRVLSRRGYNVAPQLPAKTLGEVRRFLADWTRRIDAAYLMVSLPPEFAFPAKNSCNTLLEKAVLPHCREFGLPLALMPGARRGVNPQLGLAADGVGLSDMSALARLCARFPGNKFMATVLARENQHELCVVARKFRNLHIFGCWWFTNVPLLVEEITRMRLELVGLSITPQHSDARVLEQIVYKWRHSREVIARVLAEKYVDLAETGWTVSRAEIERDVGHLFGGAFEEFCRG